MKRFSAALFLSLGLCGLAACNSNEAPDKEPAAGRQTALPTSSVRSDHVTYGSGAEQFRGYIAYNERVTGRRPIVLVVPEWWGLNDYARRRANQLAELGYFAFAVDMYGNGRIAANPDEAGRLSGPFYSGPQLGNSRLALALAQAKTYAQADSSETAAIGYCFGGAMVLQAARTGMPFDGVVSFHGNLPTQPPLQGRIATRILVCHGTADQFIKPEEIATFRQQLDSAGVQYTFNNYEHATHAFTNPDATETGKKFNLPIAYNGAADSASWRDMRAFFTSLFTPRY